MNLFSDLKKVVLKHSIIRFLNYAEVDDVVYQLIVDKNLELAAKENERLKEENRKLKIDGILGKENTIDFELNGKTVQLDKKGILQLATTYQETQFTRGNGQFQPEDIVGISIGEYSIHSFYVHYKDGDKTFINQQAEYKYDLFFDLFNLKVSSFSPTIGVFYLENDKNEDIVISKGTALSSEFLRQFSKGKEHIRLLKKDIS